MSRPLLLDTSAAVALVVGDHERHAEVAAAVAGQELGLCGHAAFETYSVLTRLPPPARRSAAAVRRTLMHNFPSTRFLSAERSGSLLGEIAAAGIAGGAVYDALIGAAALEHDATLVTRDVRALDVYRALDVRLDVLT